MQKPTLRNIAIVAGLTAVASPALAIDSCLIGLWAPSPGAMAAQFEQNPSMHNVEIIGSVIMELSNNGGAYNLNNMVIKVQNPGMPAMEMTMQGNGEFAAIAESGNFTFTMGEFDYAIQAKIDMAGSPMVMDVPFSEEMAPMGGGQTGTYTCTETDLVFDTGGETGRLVNEWRRM